MGGAEDLGTMCGGMRKPVQSERRGILQSSCGSLSEHGTFIPNGDLGMNKLETTLPISQLIVSLFALTAPGLALSEPKPDAHLHFVSTTDVHGYIIPSKSSLGVPIGGVDTMSGYFVAARKLDAETVLLDSGDMFQGTIVSNMGEGAAVAKFFNYAGYSAAAVGNHEFDFGPVGPDSIVRSANQDPLGALKARIGESRFAYLGANICSLDEDACADPASYKTAGFVLPYIIKQVQGVNVGIIGLTTAATPDTTMRPNVSRLKFFPLYQALDRYVPEMKSRGADVIVVIAHSGGKCDAQNGCTSSDEIFQTLDSVSDGTRKAIGVVLGGHTHNKVNVEYHGVRVVIAGRYGQSFGYTTLDFHGTDGSTKASSELVDFCQNVYADTKACDKGTGALVAPGFHNVPVVADAAATQLLAKEFADADVIGKLVVGKAPAALSRDTRPESTMGDMMADALRACFDSADCTSRADVALQNNGGVRSEIGAGDVTYNAVFQSMPFDNCVATAQMTGSQLRDLLALWFDANKELPQVSGLTIHFAPNAQTTRTIVNGAGAKRAVIDPIVSIEPFDAAKVYSVEMSDFLATGGEGLDFIMTHLSPAPSINYDRKLRDAMVDYFKAHPSGVSYGGAPARLVAQ
jgi:5'-nucleotidase